MKKLILIIFIFLLSCPSFAMYKVITEEEKQKQYQEFVDKITPEMAGIKPTNDFAYQKLINETTPEALGLKPANDFGEYEAENTNQAKYINEKEFNSMSLRSINEQKNNMPFIAKVLGILIFGLLITFVQWFWWFFTEYVPKIQKEQDKNEKQTSEKLQFQTKNTLEQITAKEISNTTQGKIGCFCYFVAFAFSVWYPIYRYGWSDEIIVNILGYPIQVFFGTVFIGSIFYAFCSILWYLINKILDIFKKLPYHNYYILGYITVCYLLYIIIISWDSRIDYGFYEILRWLITCFSAWTAARLYKKAPQSFWILVFSAIAILFNPVIKITLEKEVWQIIDIITLVIILVYAYKNKFLHIQK